MYSFSLERKFKDEEIAALESLIESNPDVRELKRDLAVKMAIKEYPHQKITQLLVLDGTNNPSILSSLSYSICYLRMVGLFMPQTTRSE